MSDLMRAIVEELKKPPLNEKLTLVSFSSKTPQELLQIVNNVLALLDARQKRSIREKPVEEAENMCKFLLVLNYRHQLMENDLPEFTRRFMQADTDIIYPLLYWILGRIPSLSKRAYVARFLAGGDIPEEFFADEQIVSEYQRYTASQSEFKETHKQLEKLRKTRMKPEELQEEIDTLEGEREQLTTKLTRLREKLTSSTDAANVNFEEILSCTHKLRKQQEEESKLQQSLNEQQEKLVRSEKHLEDARQNLKELTRSDLANQDPMRILGRLREQVNEQRQRCDEHLEKEIRERHKKLRELEKNLHADPMTSEAVMELENEVSQLQEQIEDLTLMRDKNYASMDNNISWYRQQAIGVDKTEAKMEEQMLNLREEENEYNQELRRLDAELAELSVDGERPRTDAELRTYMDQLTKKTATYRAYKARLHKGKSELEVLMRTEEILRSRADNIEEFNRELEKKHGVEGFQDIQNAITDASEQKSELDQHKGATLDEMSQLVEEICRKLKDKKNSLAPQIKELRSIRHRFDEVEGEYNKKKKIYDNTRLGLESERMKLEQDLNSNMMGVLGEESTYHFLHNMTLTTQIRIDQMREEMEFTMGDAKLDSKNSSASSYAELFKESIAFHEKEASRLLSEKKNVGETHDEHVEQRAMFVHLRDILRCKKQIQQDEQARKESKSNMMDGTSNMFGMDNFLNLQG